MNSLTVNTTEVPFAVLPTQIHIDPGHYYKSTRDVCYWTNEQNFDDSLVDQFISKAKEFNYSEEQALSVLTYNNYDLCKSQCDLHIYRPIKGLDKVDVKHIVKVISDGISKTVKSREHRDFDDILLLFPGFSIGDVLNAYSKHRFLIKKQTYRVKKSIKKSVCKPFMTNGSNLRENESTWNESCLDTQFQMVYRKHFQLIQNHDTIQDVIDRDLSEMKQSNRNGIKCEELTCCADADGMLNLLRKMNRKRNKLGSALDKTQLLAILNSVYSEKMTKSAEEEIVSQNQSPCVSSPSNSPNADITSTSSKEPAEENHFEEKFHDYVKGSLNNMTNSDDTEIDDKTIADSLKIILDEHEAVLSGFKNFIPSPNKFQQLSHSWDNMDFGIFLLGLSQFGLDFKKISDSVFTKSESMVQSFYLNYNGEFSLDSIVSSAVNEIPEDQLISPETVKIEEYVSCPEVYVLLPEMICDDQLNKINAPTSSKSSMSSSKKSKCDPSPIDNQQSSDDDNPTPIVTRHLRSRSELKDALRSKVESEKKLNDKPTKKRLKREAKNSSDHYEISSKQCRRA